MQLAEGPAQLKYGRWPSRREAFKHWFRVFADFVARENLGELHPLQCEVTYINHITPNAAFQTHGQLDQLLTVVGRPSEFLPEPEESAFRTKYVIRDEDQAVGRLHVQCEPAINSKDGSPAYLLNLTARGKPQSDSLEGALACFDLGREWIVRGFAALTTPVAHEARRIRHD